MVAMQGSVLRRSVKIHVCVLGDAELPSQQQFLHRIPALMDENHLLSPSGFHQQQDL